LEYGKACGGGCTGQRCGLSFSVGKSGPDRDTMTPIKEPCPGWYTIDAWHYLFWQRLAHPEGSRDGPALRSRNRLAFFPPGPLPCAGPVEPPWSFLARPMLARHGDGRRVPARILPPPTGYLPRGYPDDCPSLSRAGGAKREAGRGRSGPNERRFRVRR
jgi:hypothetical protein